jgi:hypothetical protein
MQPPHEDRGRAARNQAREGSSGNPVGGKGSVLDLVELMDILAARQADLGSHADQEPRWSGDDRIGHSCRGIVCAIAPGFGLNCDAKRLQAAIFLVADPVVPHVSGDFQRPRDGAIF